MDNLTIATFLLVIVTFLLVITTFVLVRVTHRVKEAAELQPVTSMTVAFQDEWHSMMARKMRGYLYSHKCREEFDKAIEKAYGKKIHYTNIIGLLKPDELQGNQKDDNERFEDFRSHLENIPYIDPIRPYEPLFSALDALEHVLLTCDRLAILQDQPKIMKTFIVKYEPLMHDLAPILQAYIAVRKFLKLKGKVFKKDYMLLLRRLCLEDKDLFQECVHNRSKVETRCSKVI